MEFLKAIDSNEVDSNLVLVLVNLCDDEVCHGGDGHAICRAVLQRETVLTLWCDDELKIVRLESWMHSSLSSSLRERQFHTDSLVSVDSIESRDTKTTC